MEFRILGPLSVTSDGRELEVSGAQRRAVLALLLVRANRVVPPEVLIEELWEGQPPKSAVTTLQTYVYQLRKSLPLDSLRTRPTGYVLEVATDDLDARRFEHAVKTAAQAENASPQWVADRLREALGWWRGPALADFDGLAWAEPERARLESLRIGAVEDLVDARLALGEHSAVIPELELLVGEHPLRERPWAQLMLALYRSGRQAEALRAYARLRRTLGEELGIEPGDDVAKLETAILRHDPQLRLPERTVQRTVEPDGDEAAPEPPTVGTVGRRRRVAVVAIAATTAAVLAIGAFAWVARSNESVSEVPAPSGYRPSLHATGCPPIVQQWDSTARCGELVVPEDRARPHGRKIRLGVYRFPARVAHPTSDPVVQVPGDFRLLELPQDGILRARSDSIYLAGRGFFGSQPRLTCPEVNQAAVRSLARPLRSPQSEAEFLGGVQSCRTRWVAQGVHLASYSAAETAADVRDLAFALGIAQINLVAGGTSTVDAREVASRFPGLVRSILLVNVTPPGANRWDGAITNAAAALDRYVADCAAEPRCAATFPDPSGQLRSGYTRTRDAPSTFRTVDPNAPNNAPIEVLLDGDRTMQFAVLALSDDVALPLLAAAIADPQSGQAAVDFAARYVVAPDDASWGARLSNICVDEIGSVAHEELSVEAHASPQLAYITADPLLDACPIWRTPAVNSSTPSPVATPTLILQGDLDPFTSIGWAEDTARSFGHATIVRLPHLGDVASTGNACVTTLRTQFLAHPSRRIRSDACQDQIEPIQFSGT